MHNKGGKGGGGGEKGGRGGGERKRCFGRKKGGGGGEGKREGVEAGGMGGGEGKREGGGEGEMGRGGGGGERKKSGRRGGGCTSEALTTKIPATLPRPPWQKTRDPKKKRDLKSGKSYTAKKAPPLESSWDRKKPVLGKLMKLDRDLPNGFSKD